MVLDAIKRHFPIKAHSIDEFIELLQERESKSVVCEPLVMPEVRPIGFLTGFALMAGIVGDCRYSAKFKSTCKSGRPIIFEETYYPRTGSLYDSFDSGSRKEIALKTLLTTNERLRRISEEVPGIKTTLLVAEGEMDENNYQEMRRHADYYNIKPF